MRVIIGFALWAAALAAAPTYYQDVVPILQKHCQGCHRPGEAGPMSFLAYSSTKPWAKAIREAVRTRRMPPWSADGSPRKFSNDPSLTAAEIETLSQWAETGSLEGDPRQAPAPVGLADGWNIGKPDLVFEMPKEFTVPADGVIEYQHIVVPTSFKEDRWVQAVEVRPGNRAVVHHIVVFVRPPGSRWFKDALPGVPATREPNGTLGVMPVEEMPEFLLSYTPGRPPVALPLGQARLIKAGSDIVFQLHYTSNGRPASDRSKVGLIFAKEPPRERVATLPVVNRSFVIPPGEANYRVDAAGRVDRPARLLRMIPHMHVRGKSFEIGLRQPAGDRQTLLRVPRYDFNWQHAYYLEEPVELTPGAVVELTGWYDNSPNNKWNPDPKAEVRWGDQTFEEMMIAYLDVAMPASAEPWRVLARPAQPASTMASVKSKLIGVWNLVSFEQRRSDGSVVAPYGEKPLGRITYDAQGRMSAQLMRRGRKGGPAVGAGTYDKTTEAELREIVQGFIAYYGTYDVNESNRTVIHHVEACLIPSWVGTDLTRTYEFSGNRLILTAELATGTATLVWERAKN